jgi:radical SAM protein (TIGR01212 family)
MSNQIIKPINFYSGYMKKAYGQRIQKVSVEAGFTCPNRDGKVAHGGCTYCNNESFSPMLGSGLSVSEQVRTGIERLKRRYKAKQFLAYFQSYSNTYAPLNTLKDLYSQALAHPEVIGLSIGTRPDCIDDEILDYLQQLSEQYDITIEYGLESMSDKTLTQINRGHDYQCYLDAIEKTAKRGIKICTHIIIGLPGEQRDHWIETAKELSKQPIDFLKIHQLHIVKNTVLGAQYTKKPFKTLNEQEYINILIEFLEHLDNRIIIQRLFGEAPQEILLSEHWHSSLSELRQKIETEMIQKNTYQGRLCTLSK